MPRSREAEPLLHPAAEEPWFRALSKEKQEQFHRAVQDDGARDIELLRQLRLRYQRSALLTAATFGAFDWFCPGGGVPAVVLALMVGGMLGALLEHFRAARTLSGSLALVVFFLFEWITRNGLSGLHLFLLFPVGAICAIQGLRRESGD